MGKVPEPRKIRRIGLVVELEDGGKIMIYADGLTHAEVTLDTEYPVHEYPWGTPDRIRESHPPQTTVTITGIEAYRITETMPAMASHMLEALKDGTGQEPADLPPARRLEP